MSVLVVVEHDRGNLSPASLEALTAARTLGSEVHALTLGAAADGAAPVLAAHGAAVVHQVHHDLLADYGPEAWGESVAQAVRALSPDAVVACGTDRGNEVMAQVAARLALPFVANATEITPGDPWSIVRVRWGGSLLERCTLTAATKLVSVAHHSVEASEAPAAGATQPLSVELDPSLARTVVAERVERAAGVAFQLLGAVHGNERGAGDEAAVALGEAGTFPNVAIQHVIGQFDHLRRDVTIKLLRTRRLLGRCIGCGGGLALSVSHSGNSSRKDKARDDEQISGKLLQWIESAIDLRATIYRQTRVPVAYPWQRRCWNEVVCSRLLYARWFDKH